MTGRLPSIVLLVLDTVGAKHLSLYGYPRPTSPNLERIARECTVYTRCFAPACWTVPSHASVFTGLYPAQHGAYETRYELRENLPHLVSLLKGTGYRTLGISANGAVSPATGLCRDFDEFYDLGKLDPYHLWSEGKTASAGSLGIGLLERLKQAVTPAEVWRLARDYWKETGRLDQLLGAGLGLLTVLAWRCLRPTPLDNATPYTRKTLRLLKRFFRQETTTSPPYFLFVNFLQAHHHYRPPLWRRRFSRWYHRAHVSPLRFYGSPPSPALTKMVSRYTDLYDDEVSYLDAVVGRVWQMLKGSPGFDNTMVIITSDHGEHLGEKGHYTHILSLYNELLWVPLLIRYPGQAAGGKVDDRLVSLTDLYATILDLVDSPFPRPESSFSLLDPPRRQVAVAQCLAPEMWREPLAQLERSSLARGRFFSPPVFAVITAEGTKVIGKKDGSLEVYQLKRGMAEEHDFGGDISFQRMADLVSWVEGWKKATGFADRDTGV